MDNNIFFTSDTHLFHGKEFLWGGRGFNSVEEMVEEIIKRWNAVVSPEDEVYHLGDLVLNDIDRGVEAVKRLNGKIHLIRGNHDTEAKLEKYAECPNIISIEWATMIKYKKISFFLSHAPSIYRSMDDKPNKQGIINLHGHTHQERNFLFDDNPYVYHVGMDSHNLTPIKIDDIIIEITKKKEEIIKERNKNDKY